MENFHCNICGKTSYSAHKHITECPYCGVERFLIINPEMLSLSGELSNAKIIIDRRSSETPVDIERRNPERGVPLGWFLVSGR